MSTRPWPHARSRPEWLLAVCTLALVVFYYLARADQVGVFSPARGWQALTPGTLAPTLHFIAAALVLGLIPLLAARVLTGLGPAQLGLGLGDWRSGLRWLALGLPIAILAGRIGAAAPPMRAVYPLDTMVTPDLAHFAPYAALEFLYYGAWEVLFRGVLLFGLRPRIGAGPANLTQTGLSVTAHFGRALNETLSALPAGLLFGWLTLRLRSIWYIAVLHWVVGVSMDWFILNG
ncbi:MAG TPA: CPBP family intramembrane glutamic endopeptidase [Longimicrobiales bacterium]|nr:CPBP family intramembrane glutamic endopeptidase [Longimicrobiales bacterium]